MAIHPPRTNVPARATSWHDLPREVVDLLRAQESRVIEETMATIRAELPDAAELDEPFWRNLRLGLRQTVAAVLEEVESGRPGGGRDLFVELGRFQARAGRTLDETLALYRIGARRFWRVMADAGVEAGVAPETLYRLAESIFAYIDELSADTARGYVDEQSATAGDVQVRRTELVRLVLREPPPSQTTIEEAALAAGVELSLSLAMLVAAEDERDRLVRALPSYAVAGPREFPFCALVPDPDAPRRRDELASTLSHLDVQAALGPTVGWERAGLSLDRARRVFALVRAAAIPQRPLVLASEHQSLLVLTSDQVLAGEFADDQLSPLEDLTPVARRKLELTLLAWLGKPGQRQALSRELSIHPQTVRYRLNQLRDLFGPQLENPDGRFQLELALRIRQLRDGADS